MIVEAKQAVHSQARTVNLIEVSLLWKLIETRKDPPVAHAVVMAAVPHGQQAAGTRRQLNCTASALAQTMASKHAGVPA